MLDRTGRRLNNPIVGLSGTVAHQHESTWTTIRSCTPFTATSWNVDVVPDVRPTCKSSMSPGNEAATEPATSDAKHDLWDWDFTGRGPTGSRLPDPGSDARRDRQGGHQPGVPVTLHSAGQAADARSHRRFRALDRRLRTRELPGGDPPAAAARSGAHRGRHDALDGDREPPDGQPGTSAKGRCSSTSSPEVVKLIPKVPGIPFSISSLQAEIHPALLPPFSGVNVMVYVVRPPARAPRGDRSHGRRLPLHGADGGGRPAPGGPRRRERHRVDERRPLQDGQGGALHQARPDPRPRLAERV